MTLISETKMLNNDSSIH